MLSKIKDIVDTLSNNLNFEYSELKDDSGIVLLYYVICRDKDIAEHICKCAYSVGLDTNVEEIPFSLTVNYQRIIICGDD
jgi:hypothetical protein